MELQTLSTDYVGQRRQLFWLALRSSLLTVLTVGFYRFWMKTRLRRFYWSAIRPGGIPLEYTGTGVEKLMGFLIAVVFLAFYIGVFNLILMFLSFSLWNNNFVAYGVSFVGLIPVYFYAQYRARRYVLARTRWRGMRFGIDPAAWSYAWRAVLHWLASILTLGILWPRQVFWLEKFRVDRTWFGRARFVQEGRWTMLLGAAVHLYIGLALCGVAVAGVWIDDLMLALLAIGVPWLLVGFMHFQIRSFCIMTAHKRLGEHVGFTAEPRTWRVIRIYVFGNMLAALALWAGIMALTIIAGLSVFLIGADLFDTSSFGTVFANDSAGFEYALVAGIAVVYFGVFIFWGVLGQVFVKLPLMRHYAETLRIGNSHHLAAIQQRPRDEMAEAEGFAEALDIGAAI